MTDSHGPKVPRASVTVVRSAVQDLRQRRRRSAIRRTVAGVVVLVALIWAGNTFLIARPVAAALAADSLAGRVEIAAHLHYYVDLTTLVLDLRRADDSLPETTLYALVVAAAGMHAADLDFHRVVLTGDDGAAFILSGADFDRLGAEFSTRGNPVDWARRVPPLLRGPAGSAAFGPVAGPLPPLLGLQPLETAPAARRWRGGTR